MRHYLTNWANISNQIKIITMFVKIHSHTQSTGNKLIKILCQHFNNKIQQQEVTY